MGDTAAGAVDFLRKGEFARMQGWHASAVSKFAKAGRIVLAPDGKMVDVRASLERLEQTADPAHQGVAERHARERQAKGAPPAVGTLPAVGGSHRVNPHDASWDQIQRSRAQSEAARAKLLEIELAEKEGRLVPVDQVREAAFRVAREARNALQQLGPRLAPVLAAETDATKIHDLIDAEVRRICEQLAGAMEQPHA